jgi:3-mercaptopyruvate sulfurtransferase SseA
VALQLKRAGVRRVRPLAGGFEEWHKLNYPVEPAFPETPANENSGIKADANSSS